jgi:hypothetical protein
MLACSVFDSVFDMIAPPAHPPTNSKRIYAMRSSIDMACDALHKIIEVRNSHNANVRLLARCRWHYAAECLTNGYYHAKMAKFDSDSETQSRCATMVDKCHDLRLLLPLSSYPFTSEFLCLFL